MNILPLSTAVRNLVFPGSAIISGKSDDGLNAVSAYFISGINDRERNRIFVESDDGISITPFNSPAADNIVNCAIVGSGSIVINDPSGSIDGQITLNSADVDVCLRINKHYGTADVRHTFEYSSIESGTGYMLPAFTGSEYPFGAFEGEPVPVAVSGSIFDVVADIWENLRPETRVSLWVRSTDLHTGKSISRIINRNR